MWHAPNNKAWGHIDTTWLDFVSDLESVKLMFITNGFNLFGDKRSSWSTWPMFFLNYNLLSWLMTKRFFMMLSLIMLSLKSVKIANFDLYLELMVEELEQLWKGVRWWMYYRFKGNTNST